MAKNRWKLAVEAQSVRVLRAETEKLRTKLNDEREEAERRYTELQRANANERETAMAIEKSLRDHYSQLETKWRRDVGDSFSTLLLSTETCCIA